MLNKMQNYMKFVVKTYPDGCASYNWRQSSYNDILESKRLPEDWEMESIIDDCLDEFHNDLGLCGCGNPEDTQEVIRQILNIKSDNTIKYEERQQRYSDICNSDMGNSNYNGLIQFVLYILDNKEFLEHGSSIGGAWLTQKGRVYLDLLNMQNKVNTK